MSARVRTCGFRCPLFVVFKNITSGACQHVWERVFSDFHSLLCSRISPQEHVSTFENMCFQMSTLYCVQEYHLRSMSVRLRTCVFRGPLSTVFKNITSGACQQFENIRFHYLKLQCSRISPQKHVSSCENICFHHLTLLCLRISPQERDSMCENMYFLTGWAPLFQEYCLKSMSVRVRTCVFSGTRASIFENITQGAVSSCDNMPLQLPRSTVSRISPQEHVRTSENMWYICFQLPTLYCVQEYLRRSMSARLKTCFKLSTLHCFKNFTSGACQNVWEHVKHRLPAAHTLLCSRISPHAHVSMFENAFPAAHAPLFEEYHLRSMSARVRTRVINCPRSSVSRAKVRRTNL
jgi:hypothetical protein